MWLVGARGGLATTVIAGTFAIARKLAGPIGLLTESQLFEGFPFVDLGRLVFGGHDIRQTTTREAALEVGRDANTISPELCRLLATDFRKVDREVRTGSAHNAGRAILSLADPGVRRDGRKLRRVLAELRADIADFRKRHRLHRVVVVNLASTEPPVRLGRVHRTLGALDAAIDKNEAKCLRPSLLYAYAAAAEGCPFIHFTPSNVTLVPAVQELFERNGVPYMGADGKTGETLVKSALAPMFKYRNLRVLSWQGYNLLGDRDGVVLNDRENKRSKVETKDSLLPTILGYPLQTHVAIDYVESLGDLKTAWDYIHFEGFLNFRMHMQFTWHGCDSILAAPLILDMVRLADYAAERGETGPLTQLACFFKKPVGLDVNDLHYQWHMLEHYAKRERENRGEGNGRGKKKTS